jgi:hypothetical protein
MRPHHKAEHMAAHDQIVKTQKPLATQAPSTQAYRKLRGADWPLTTDLGPGCSNFIALKFVIFACIFRT